MAPGDEPLRLGIVGLSEGNGHPYSWSAICNGYDREAMAEECPFPAIPDYLSRHRFPSEQLGAARVTHVWCDDGGVAASVARCARIPNVAPSLEAMVGHVDAVVVARDDYRNHRRHVEPFLRAGLPVFVDKPIAVSMAAAEELLDLQQWEGQVFTCSALRYAPEFSPVCFTEALRPLRLTGSVMNGWDKYSIHVLEPMLAIAGEYGPPSTIDAERRGDCVALRARWPTGVEFEAVARGEPGGVVSIEAEGADGPIRGQVGDPFFAFRGALQAFSDVVRGDQPPPSRAEILAVVRLIEAGATA